MSKDMGVAPASQSPGHQPAASAANASSQSGVPNAGQRFRSLYSPERGIIACVLLQAAFGGDRQPCHMFGSGDWEIGFPDKTFGWVEMAAEEWRALGMLTREGRVAAWQDVVAAPTADAPESSSDA